MAYSFIMFQFLIGTVKTFLDERIDIDPTSVSIPHRYCKNELTEEHIDELEESFNSS